MTQSTVEIGSYTVTAYTCNTVIVGSGCAGLAAANRLHHYGQRDIALVTDHFTGGISRNTGSDKQTYYKLTLSGNEPDSVMEMAQTLFSGGCVDGEHALCEAALSAPCFLRLCELGVPFPANRYGEYIGYKTDHDPRTRATSAGPLTSRLMTEALERAVREKGIAVYDNRQAIQILTENGSVRGLLCLVSEDTPRFELFLCPNIVWATGGPAAVYGDSCYPLGHDGMSGVPFTAGAHGKNLTEWQYGLASIHPRWNVSGTYMQALPRFVSTDSAGHDVREFLQDYIPDAGRLLTLLFLKGYQWPFDTRKAKDGSSMIDLAVYIETKVKGRRVFLDYSSNPLGGRFDFSALGEEAYSYLHSAGALLDTPYNRLAHMNGPAVELYRSKGVDLKTEWLEIALCSQHYNGGITVDAWWQTNVEGLFAVGEAAGTHGIYRPGGSALNAGQVGAERAARYISAKRQNMTSPIPGEKMQMQLSDTMSLAERCIAHESNIGPLRSFAASMMSKVAAVVRDENAMRRHLSEITAVLSDVPAHVRIQSMNEAAGLYRYLDILRTQATMLAAMLDYAGKGGKSRGAAIYLDGSGQKFPETLPEICRFTPDDGMLAGKVQEVAWTPQGYTFRWRDVHPIPQEDLFFENVWRAFREHQNVY